MKEDYSKWRYQSALTLKSKLARLVWVCVCLLLFRPTPVWACHKWRVFLLKSFGAKIGKGCKIAPSVRVWAPWNLTMGDFSCLADHVDCYTVDAIVIGSKVTVSQRSFLCTASHDIRSLTRPLIHSPICIDHHAWVCAEAFVGPGVTIGEGSVVAGRSVVMRDVDAWKVVGGNPAKVLKERVLEESET